jgi:C1A family cysteine protease
MEHGPLGATITANGALQRFSGDGVFTGCSTRQTNHIVVIVGWNDDEGENGVWIMRNSWGTSHGKDGYAKIPYGCSRLGEQATWADLKIPGVGYVKAIEAR